MLLTAKILNDHLILVSHSLLKSKVTFFSLLSAVPITVAPAPQPPSDTQPSVPEDSDVIITSSEKREEGGSADMPVVIVNDEDEEKERQGVQEEDQEVIGAFSGMLINPQSALSVKMLCALCLLPLVHILVN